MAVKVFWEKIQQTEAILSIGAFKVAAGEERRGEELSQRMAAIF